MTSSIRRDVEAVLEKHKNSFEKAVIYRASAAAGPMADWVLAVLSFS
jgi:dynein heavy chain 2